MIYLIRPYRKTNSRAKCLTLYARKKSIRFIVAIYSISDLEELTGVKAHTIRIWEKRYGVVTPERTETNIRYYQDDDLKALINIALLNRNGFKISHIAKMAPEKIAEHVADITAIDLPGKDQVDALSLSLIELDIYKFESILDSNIKQMGLEVAMMEVIYPFIDKLGLLWLSGAMDVSHEMYLNTMLKRKLMAEIDHLPLVKKGPTIILFLPPGNTQELSMLFVHFLMKKRGIKVINIGTESDFDSIKAACRISKADKALTLNTDEQDISFAQFIEKVLIDLPCGLVVSGRVQDLAAVEKNPNLHILNGLSDTLEFLDTFTAPS